MNDFVYEYEKLVVGGSLSSLIYAYHEGLPLIIDTPRVPYFFDKTKEGISKKDLWHKFSFMLSMSGLLPMADKTSSVRLEDGILKAFGDGPYYIKFRADDIEFYDESLNEKKDSIFEVIDWVNVRSGMVHPVDYIDDESDFVKKIIFYPSYRMDGNHDKKDLIALSYLNKQQLQDGDYSETFTRLKVLDMMKQAGIRGRANGHFLGKQRFLSLKIEVALRETRIIDSREDKLLEKYLSSYPERKELLSLVEVLGSPYDGHNSREE